MNVHNILRKLAFEDPCNKVNQEGQKYIYVVRQNREKTSPFEALVATGREKKTREKWLSVELGQVGLRGLAGPNKRKRKERVIIGLF